MEGLTFLLVLLAVFFVIFLIIISAVRSGHTADTYQRLARHYRGTCVAGGIFSHPKVHFMHAGSAVTVDVYSTGGKHPEYYTQIQFMLPTVTRPIVRCEIYPEGMWSRFGKLFGMADIEIGAGAFDDIYVIKAHDSLRLREMLSPAVQDQIDRLRRFLGNNDIYVSFDSRRLLVKKRSFIREAEPLLTYAELAIQLFETAVRPSDEGIEFIDDDTPPDAIHAMCQICGEEIEDDVVFCRRCKTPHHRDCWQYYGACSTYGCQEKKYLRPESKRARREQKRL